MPAPAADEASLSAAPRMAHPALPSSQNGTRTRRNRVQALKGTVGLGQMVMSPQGVMHFYYNAYCDGVTMIHTFPTARSEDFFSMWASVDQMDDVYIDSVLPGLAGRLHADLPKTIPDVIHTVNAKCAKRCGMKPDYWWVGLLRDACASSVGGGDNGPPCARGSPPSHSPSLLQEVLALPDPAPQYAQHIQGKLLVLGGVGGLTAAPILSGH